MSAAFSSGEIRSRENFGGGVGDRVWQLVAHTFSLYHVVFIIISVFSLLYEDH